MTDIVERLREACSGTNYNWQIELHNEAADEIVRLRDWISDEGSRIGVCTFNVLGVKCDNCMCSRNPNSLAARMTPNAAVDAGTVCADPMREAMRRFTTPPRKGTPAADLTEGEKLALCIAAGAPTETVMQGGFMTVRTTVPCGVADRGDGGYIVAVMGWQASAQHSWGAIEAARAIADMAATAAERESCAMLCEDGAGFEGDHPHEVFAAAIRAREEPVTDAFYVGAMVSLVLEGQGRT